MSSYRRMTLIDEDELERLRRQQVQDYNPVQSTMIDLQREIDRTLHRSDMPSDQKMLVLRTAYQRFKKLETQLRADTKPVALVESKPPEEEPKEETKTEEPNPKAPTVPRNFTRKLNTLMKMLERKPDVITRSENDELVIEGKVVPGSSYTDVLESMFVKRNQHKLIGLDKFFLALGKLKVPERALSRHDMIYEYHQATTQIGGDRIPSPPPIPSSHRLAVLGKGGRKGPPGKRPRILYVYRH